MDPISVTFGLIPLIAGAVKGAKKTRTKLHALVKYANEVKRLHLRFMVQESRVRSQSILLIHNAGATPVDIDIEKSLLGHNSDELPEATSLDNEKIKRYLGDSYDICKELFHDIDSGMTLISKYLEHFQPSESQKRPGVSERVSKGVAFTFRESTCIELIDDLQASLDSLTQINRDKRDVQMAREMNASRSAALASKASSEPSSPLPPFKLIKEAMNDLYLALASSFGDKGSHKQLHRATKHQAKLYIDNFKHKDEIQSTLLLSCECLEEYCSPQGGSKLLSLTVKSVETSEDTSENSVQDQFDEKMTPPVSPNQVSGSLIVPTIFEAVKRTSSIARTARSEEFQLCTCLHRVCCSGMQSNQKGKGRMELKASSLHTLSTPKYSQTFFPTHSTGYCRISDLAKDFISLQDAFKYAPEPNFTKLDQLKLARNIAIALLKFHDTPWINDFWGVRDLSLVSVGRGDIGSSLGKSMRTLHVGLDLAHGLAHNPPPRSKSSAATLSRQTLLASAPQEVEVDDYRQRLDVGTISGTMQLHGIYNLPLYYLCVVLLQIDRWEHINEDDLAQVYRLAKKNPRLGERYAYIVQRCLKCCFAQAREADYDLSDFRLQTDVYQDVVCGISQILEGLKIDDEE